MKNSFYGSVAKQYETFTESIEAGQFELFTGEFKTPSTLLGKPEFVISNMISGFVSMLSNSGVGKYAFICIRTLKLSETTFAIRMYCIFSAAYDKDTVILSYNASFDVNVLLSECYRYGCTDAINKINSCAIQCIMQLVRMATKSNYNVKLSRFHSIINMTRTEQDHRALNDVDLAIECYDYALSILSIT